MNRMTNKKVNWFLIYFFIYFLQSFVHLTNYSLNKTNEKFSPNPSDDVISDPEIKWTLTSLWKYFSDHKIDSKPILKGIEDILIKTVLSIEKTLFKSNLESNQINGNCFEFLGFDILLDVNLKPWLLEVNLSPSLSCEAPIDFNLKTKLVADLFNLVGINSNEKVFSQGNKQGMEKGIDLELDFSLSLRELENKR